MIEQKKYNWALLGCGSIAQSFAKDLQRLPNAKLYAVASRDVKKAKKYAMSGSILMFLLVT